MAEITLPPETRIRVITHALKLLSNFNKSLSDQVSRGAIIIDDRMQTMTRKNAEEEGKLRRKLAKIRKEAGMQTARKAQEDDPLVDALKINIMDILPDYTFIETGQDAGNASKAMKLVRVDTSRLQLDIISDDDDQLTQDASLLCEEIYSMEVDREGEDPAFFSVGVAQPTQDHPENSQVRAFEIQITSE